VLGLGGISGEEVVVKVSYVPGKVAALMKAEPVRTAVVSRPFRSTISAREDTAVVKALEKASIPKLRRRSGYV
jgi:hypothetical protein